MRARRDAARVGVSIRLPSVLFWDARARVTARRARRVDDRGRRRGFKITMNVARDRPTVAEAYARAQARVCARLQREQEVARASSAVRAVDDDARARDRATVDVVRVVERGEGSSRHPRRVAREEIGAWRVRRLATRDERAAAYAAACVEHGARVSSRVLRQLEKKYADVASSGLGSSGAKAIAAGVAENATMESLNVSRNQIDDDGVSALCAAAARAKVLRALNFSENKVSSAIAPTCAEAVKKIKVLNFSACGVDDACATALFAALRSNTCGLESLNLSRNKLTDASGRCIGDALGADISLRVLNVSWNAIGSEWCAHVSRGLKLNTRLEFLSLAWNGIGDEGGKHIGDSLSVNRSLLELDLSRCRLGCDASMVISEGLRTNDVLTTLRLDHNAMGEDGGRHLMSMLLENDYLTVLTCSGSSFVDVPKKKRKSTTKHGVAAFNSHNPDGRYTLNLDDTGERAIASKLWHLESENPGSMTSAKKVPSGVDVLDDFKREGLSGVSRGVIEIQFVTSAARLARRPVVIEDEDFENILRQLRSNRLSDFERLSRLMLFCRSYYFETSHAAKLLDTFILEGTDRLQAASAIYARLLDAENAEKMFTSKFEFEKLRNILGSYAHFRAANPTGRYELNLAVDIDRTIASTMMDSATFEGRRRTWRNVRLNRTRITDVMPSGVPESLMRCMPNVGTLEFDYTSNIRASESAMAETDEKLHTFLHSVAVLTNSTSEWAAVRSVRALYALREASVRVHVNARQYQRVCDAFPPGPDRVEAAVILFNRVIDHANVPAVVGRYSSFEQSTFGARMGWRNVLGDSPQAFTMHYRLDLNCDEQASVAKHLVSAAVRDYKDVQVIRNVTINGRRLPRDPVEDDTLWSVLTAESFTPVLEFDYFGADVWDVVRRELNITEIPDEKPEREAALKRLASRLAFLRASTLQCAWIELAAADAALPHPTGDASWRKSWHETLRMICRTEHSHSSKSPLRLIFDFLDADGSASLSIDEFVAGASSALGRPIPRALLAPYFDPHHFTDDRHLGVVSFDVFEAICVENFA